MKTPLALVALSIMCAGSIPSTAAAENGPIYGNFTVTYTAGVVGTPPLCDPGNSVYVEAHGIGNSAGALGAMILTIRKCYNYLEGTYSGSFTLTSPDTQDTLTGTYTGADDAYTGEFPAVFFPFHGVLKATEGTGKFRGAKGSMRFVAMAAAADQANGNAYYAIEGNVHD